MAKRPSRKNKGRNKATRGRDKSARGARAPARRRQPKPASGASAGPSGARHASASALEPATKPGTGSVTEQPSRWRLPWRLALLLCLVTIAVYWGAIDNGFVNVDDDLFVYNNPYIKTLSWENTKQLSGVYQYWIPLTWLSHSVTYQLSGLDPAGHHLVNVVLHGLNAGLVFLITLSVMRLTRRDAPLATSSSGWWPGLVAGATALLWALHPLRVEAVAWVAERKEVLCAFFVLAACLVYLSAAELSAKRWRLRIYGVCLPLFLGAIASKPMAMSLPVVLLLLDVWPLGRLDTCGQGRPLPATLGRLVAEKVPFFALSAIAGVISLRSERSLDDFGSPGVVQLGDRLVQAVRSASFYLERTLWPTGLVPYYPRATYEGLGWWPVVGSLVLLGAAVALATHLWRRGRRGPAVALACYYVTVFPVLGILRVGNQVRADRWTYLPTISLFVLGGVAVLSALGSRPRLRIPAGATAALVLLVLSVLSVRQIELWKDSQTLWERNIALYPAQIAVAHTNLGNVLPPSEAQRQFEIALRLEPNATVPRNNLGRLYAQQGKLDEAAEQFQMVLKLEPSDAKAHNNLANIHALRGNQDDAIAEYQLALKLEPDYPDAHLNLGILLLDEGQLPQAREAFEAAARLRPEDAQARYQLARLYERQGKIDEAVRMDSEAIARRPEYVEAYIHAGAILFNAGRTEEALSWLTRAVSRFPDNPTVLKNLGLAYLSQKDYERARTHLTRARALGAPVDQRALDQVNREQP